MVKICPCLLLSLQPAARCCSLSIQELSFQSRGTLCLHQPRRELVVCHDDDEERFFHLMRTPSTLGERIARCPLGCQAPRLSTASGRKVMPWRWHGSQDLSNFHSHVQGRISPIGPARDEDISRPPPSHGSRKRPSLAGASAAAAAVLCRRSLHLIEHFFQSFALS